MVDWKSFAQRRKLNLEDFVKKFSYVEFTNWCRIRGVIPPGSMAWQLKRQEEVPEPIVEEPLYQAPVESPEEEIDYNSMTKKELVSFCRENNYEIKGNWSKQKIIKFITG